MIASADQTRPSFATPGSLSSGFFSISEAAAIVNAGEETIRRAIRAGRIPAYGSAGRLRVRLSDLMPQYVPKSKKARI